ncbi:PEP/pyruvate-binding domain-containing protein [Pseudonocardia hispaniensis]|uniref:PEP/pyruvate-binding domain-containing protein n=1 Tax=Pseudonocardia hispaniensis TaxID=904933 RepID=A0ABW1J381_9PSEU
MVSAESPVVAAARPLVLDLAHVTAASWAQVGGKAAHLGELLAAGLAVPPGFCITTDAYAQVADVAGLSERLAGPITAGQATALRERLLAAPIPSRVRAQVAAAYAGLGPDVPVAVRSSATAEDLPEASFAGQQDTSLNIVGTAALLEAVRSCWASLWTERAVSYRATAGIDQAAVRLAVVVQVMVDAQVAGVLFTADPVAGTRTRTVIDASPGLGEAVVSGAVNPDQFVVDTPTGRIVRQRLGDKRTAVRPVPGGGTRWQHRSPDTGPCLTPAQIGQLVALGVRVQEHYGAPQDLEWAIDASGALWLTQARPITTLFPLPEPVRPDRVYFCLSLAQGLVRPVTPMGISAVRVVASIGAHHMFGTPIGDARRGPAGIVTAGERLFVDITPALRSRAGRALVPRVLGVMEARSAVVLRGLFGDPTYAVERTAWWPFLRRAARLWMQFRIPLHLVQALASPAAARRRIRRVEAALAAMAEVPPGLTSAQRLAQVERLLRGVYPLVFTVVPVPAAGFAMLGVARLLAGRDLAPDDVHEVLRSLPHNVTTQMDLRLWALAVRIRVDAEAAAAVRDRTPGELADRYRRGALPAVLQEGVAEFLRAHGHHAVAEIDLGMPRWSDDPGYLFGVLAGYLRPAADPGLAPDARFARGERAAIAAVASVVDRVRRRSRLRATAVGFALGRVRALAGIRETHKDLLIRLFAAARAQLVLVGRELADRGLLDDPADIVYLDLVQAAAAVAGADLRPQVERRRAAYDRELRRRRVPRVLLSDGTEPEALRSPPAEGVGTLVGSPASAGTVTAPARVVLDPADAGLRPGEILVAPSTDPGWTPLFLTAGGLVMEMGGANSHGAVVAREYGIPAVVGVPDATALLATGEMITVDGAAGSVARVPPQR